MTLVRSFNLDLRQIGDLRGLMNDKIVEARWVVELEKQPSDRPFPERYFPLPVDDYFAADKNCPSGQGTGRASAC
jgi:hypothetical protein